MREQDLRGESAAGDSITPEQQHEEASARRVVLDANTASPSLPIYDDSLPASMQPQTPAHLAESRHRSRIDGALASPSEGRARARPTLRHTTPVRRRAHPGRGSSPVGLRRLGFEGLYGGAENADEEAL